MNADRTTSRPTMVSVYDGRRVAGFILNRARGYEAFDAEERSLGVFATIQAAAAAIPAIGEGAQP